MTRLAQEKERARLAEMRADRNWLALGDTLYPDNRLGSSIKVSVKAGEFGQGEERLEAIILRPLGANPLVIFTIPALRHVMVYAAEEWAQPGQGSQALEALKERVRVAIARINRGEQA